jgi:flagellar protein FlaJ
MAPKKAGLKEPYFLTNLKAFYIDYSRHNFKGKFQALRQSINQANIDMVFDIYMGRLLYFTTISFALAFIYSIFILLFLGVALLELAVLTILISIMAAAIVGLVFYTYPNYLIASKRKSIEANLPFAANHMGALAASGVAPHLMFKMLTDVKEYGEVANEARRIVRNIEVFGMDLVSALKQVASRTPSDQFRVFLSGVIATITTGGDLKIHLKNSAAEALTDYKLKRERYLANLSTYADFYVGVLIAAPLFFISILSLLAIVGGQIAGFSLPLLLLLGIFVVIPIINIGFLLFVHFTQPSV